MLEVLVNNQELVEQFMQGFNQIDNNDLKHTKLRLTLSLEKTQEIFEAILDSSVYSYNIEPLFNIIKTKIQNITQQHINTNQTTLAHALADLLYVTYGTAVWGKIPLQDCFLEVHKANMTKLINFTGNPIYRPDGKILYDSSYTPPNIESIIDSHTSF